MKRYHILRDSQHIASVCTQEEAIDFIRRQQAQETHYLLKPDFMIIYGQLKIVPYGKKTLKNYL